MTQDELKQVLHYCPSTGHFTWMQRTANRIRVGDVAGYVDGGYVFIRIHGILHYAHRLAFLYMTGEFPEELVDHNNRVRNDNRWCNLKLATPVQNQRNTAISKNNCSGVTGVFWEKRKKKWCASITVARKAKHLGYFDDITLATAARKTAESLYDFHPNHGRVLT